MKIAHYMRKEKSGLAFTTLEIVAEEERQGHAVSLKTPSESKLLYGQELDPDIECIHSQLPQTSYHNRKPRVMFCHGEPLSSIANGVSMRAIVDLLPLLDCFIAMRQEEYKVWSSLKRTYVVPKGIDLNRFQPIETKPHDPKDPASKLSGEPAVLYIEHWRGQRNPLYLVVAMEQVWRKFPGARLHLYNVTDQKMLDTFKALIGAAKWSQTFVRSLQGPVKDDQVNALYNRADIVVSCLYPLYARSIEAFAAGKAFIGPGYRDAEYPFRCDLDPDSIADAIIQCWENYDSINYRQWAERKHSIEESVKQCVDVYRRFL
jgi:glycosyltransferase involved in cell wall biosynthesis